MRVRLTPGAENLMFFVLDRNLYGYQPRKQELRHYLDNTALPEGDCNKVMGELFDKYDNTTDAMNEIMAKYGGKPVGKVVDPELVTPKGWEILRRLADASMNRN